MTPFADTLYLWRVERGLTQAALAEAAGIPRPNLSSLERGVIEPTLRTIRQLADALQVQPGFLVDGVTPGQEERVALNRDRMERIADSIAKQQPLGDPFEKRVARLLAAQLAHLIPSTANSRGRAREIRTTWLLLRTLLSPEELNTLVSRVEEKMAVRA
ncbi:MAG: helix-turn-helix transcriptional regulator [Candidatus Omnitrophica bacterium]|nr:helix-turn-helix transcriptional regulator [Candidatus Omnitrophota bacterium]